MSTVPVDTNDYAGLFGKLFPASEPLPGQGDSLELLKKLAKINEEEQKALLDDLVALLGQKGGKNASSLTEEKKERKKENQAKERKNKNEQKDAKLKDNSQENKDAGLPVPQPPSVPLVCGLLNREGRPCQRKEGPLHCPYHGSLREQKPLAKQFAKASAGTHPIPPDSLPKIGPDPVPSKVRPADQTQPVNAKLPWSMEEHIKFLKGLKRWGTGSIAAEQIAKYIGTRSVNAVKNYSQRYHEYHRRGVKLPNNNYNFTLEDFVMQKRRRRDARRCGSEGDTPNRGSDITDKHTPQKQKTLTLFGFQIAVDKKDTGVSTGVVSAVDKGRDSASSGHEDEDEEDEEGVHSSAVGNVYGNGVKEESEWNMDSVSSHVGGEEDGSEKDMVGIEVEETFIDDFVFLAVPDVDAFGQYQHPMPFLQGREDLMGNSANTASNARNHSGLLPLAANVEKRLTRSASRQVPRHHSSSGLDSGATGPVNRGERKRKLAQTVRTGVKRLKEGESVTDSDKVFLPPIREKEWQLKMEQESPIPTSLTTQSIQYLSSPSAPPDISVVSARLVVPPLPIQPQLLRQVPFPPSTSPSAITPVPLTYNCAPSSPTTCIQQGHRRPGPFLSSNTQRMAFVKVCTAPSSSMQTETPHNRTEVEAIDGVRRTADGVEYFVKWKGTSPKENTWEPREKIKRLWPQGNFADWDLF